MAVRVYGPNNISSIINISNYGDYVPVLYMTLDDYYKQVVASDSSSYGQLFVPIDINHDCKSSESGFIGGGTVRQFQRGVATFSDVDAYCFPGGMLYVNGSTADLMLTPVMIGLSFRHCVEGGKLLLLYCILFMRLHSLDASNEYNLYNNGRVF